MPALNTPIEVDVLDDVGMQLTTDTVFNDRALKETIDNEAFMNQVLDVYIHPSSEENGPNHTIVNVNGVNQPVFFGQPNRIKRKYVEVLARMKETRYHQPTANPLNPESGNALIPRTLQVYPFQVIRDPHPKGAAWLAQIMAEVA